MSLIADIHNDMEDGAIRLITEYRARLFSDAVRICGNSHDADDLVDRTFVKVLRNLDQHRPDKNLYGWMKAILTNLHRDDLDHPVARGTVAVEQDKLEEYAGADWSTDEQILKNSDSEALRNALSGLDPKYHQALLLRYYQDFSVKQIAAILQLPLGTVCRRLQIAHGILAGKLKAEFGKAKKPLAVLGALLLGAATLFGAYQTGFIDTLVEKWNGSADAAAEGRSDCASNRRSPIGIPSASEQNEPFAFVRANLPAESNVVAVAELITENTNEGSNEMNITSSVRKLTKRLSTVAVAAGIAATTLGAAGETAVYVATNGNDSASGTSEEPLKTIAAAVAKGTDAVYVNSGTYVEHDITLDRAVRVIGLAESRDDVIVNANSAGRCFSIFARSGGCVVVDDEKRKGGG